MPTFYFRFLLIVTLGISSFAAQAQEIRISQGGTVSACGGFFYDSGGFNDDHEDDGSTELITICPTGGPARLRAFFSNFAVRGTFNVFNGPNTGSPLLGSLTEDDNSTNPSFRATAANPSGCLTFQFISEAGPSLSGWEASITCVDACQPITAVLLNTTPAATPTATTNFIDICPGDPITFTAEGLYPENNVIYSQSDATSTFTWTFQDGTTATGTSVTKTYTETGGFQVDLSIEDSQGCTNDNRIAQQVRIAPSPVFPEPENIPSFLCIGEAFAIDLTGTDGSAGSISPIPDTFTFQTGQAFSELTILPDGNGEIYSSPLNFQNFESGQSLVRADQIVAICATMEHSWLADLGIWIECPDGTRVDLHRFVTDDPLIGGQTLGIGRRNTTTPDNPFTYCWRSDAAGTIRQTVAEDGITAPNAIPAGDYRPEGSFNGFIGCELNGEWTMNVLDSLAQDNGSIAGWSIEFSADVFPDPIPFAIPISDVVILDNGNYQSHSDDRAVILSDNPGRRNVTIGSEDSIGCVYDTTFSIAIASPISPECLDCGGFTAVEPVTASVCDGESLELDFSDLVAMDTVITWEAVDFTPFGNQLYPSAAGRYRSVLTVTDHQPNRINNIEGTLSEVCISLQNNGNLSDVTFELESPSGTVLRLVENVGGDGDDFINTCFSPAATQNINAANSPFTGTFRATRTDWSIFEGDQINGDWVLRAWDDSGNDISRFVRWTLSLNHDRELTFDWSPTTGLSCSDCPDPTVTATTQTDYTLTIATNDGCSQAIPVLVRFNSINLTVAESLTMPSCSGDSDGRIELAVSGTASPLTFSWSDDPAITTEDRTNLSAGMYTVTMTDENGCEQEFTYTLSEPDPLVVSLESITNVACAGEPTGALNVTVSGGTLPYTFDWDDPADQSTEDATALTAGTYTLEIRDANNCSVTLSQEVTEPEPLALTLATTDIVCRGANDGTATAEVTGGVPPYTFAWNTLSTNRELTDLEPGMYSVTVTDANTCVITGSETISQPAQSLEVSITQDAQGCFETPTNVATGLVSGGDMPYNFQWSSGENTPTASMLPAGEASLTITDARGCEIIATAQINSLPELRVVLTSATPSCTDRSDGSIQAIPSGGAGLNPGDYTFLWSTTSVNSSIDNLAGDRTYSVTVTGPDGCTGEASIFLPIPPAITFTSVESRVSCFGESDGALSISNITGPTGGPFTILWGPEAGGSSNNTVTGLIAGSYPLTVTDATGCSVDTMLTVTQPDTLLPATEQTNVSCNGEADGRIAVMGTGGTPPYQYQWSTNQAGEVISGLPAGDYTLTLTDANGCESITPYTITEPDVLVLLPEVRDVLCLGGFSGQAALNHTGGTGPFLYRLAGRGLRRDSVFRGLDADEYPVSITDANGCTDEGVVLIMDGPSFEIDLGPDTSIIFGDSIVLGAMLDGGIDSIRYEWVPSAPTIISCTDCPNPQIQPDFETDYTLTATDATGCVAEDRVRVRVEKIREVAVPTAFTPDDNTINDRLLVHGRPGTQVVSFQIFDRWTNLLFEDADFPVNDPNRGWDGKKDDQDVNAGVYLYKLVVQYEDFSRETLSGQTTLIR